jgi:hypothetical protein
MKGGIALHAEGIGEELRQRLPIQRKAQRGSAQRRKAQRGKLAMPVATMLHARSANLMALAASLPLSSYHRFGHQDETDGCSACAVSNREPNR